MYWFKHNHVVQVVNLSQGFDFNPLLYTHVQIWEEKHLANVLSGSFSNQVRADSIMSE